MQSCMQISKTLRLAVFFSTFRPKAKNWKMPAKIKTGYHNPRTLPNGFSSIAFYTAYTREEFFNVYRYLRNKYLGAPPADALMHVPSSH